MWCCRALAYVMHDECVTSLLKIGCHAGAHDSQSDESHPHLAFLLDVRSNFPCCSQSVPVLVAFARFQTPSCRRISSILENGATHISSGNSARYAPST